MKYIKSERMKREERIRKMGMDDTIGYKRYHDLRIMQAAGHKHV